MEKTVYKTSPDMDSRTFPGLGGGMISRVHIHVHLCTFFIKRGTLCWHSELKEEVARTFSERGGHPETLKHDIR